MRPSTLPKNKERTEPKASFKLSLAINHLIFKFILDIKFFIRYKLINKIVY